MSRRVRFRFPLLLLALACGCGVFAFMFYTWFTRPMLSDRDSALQQVDEILQTAIQYPSGIPHSNEQRYRMAHVCWLVIEPALARNQNKYRLVIMSSDDSRDLPYPVHDTIEIRVHAVFPDQTRLEFFYFQGGISDCRAIAEPSEITLGRLRSLIP